MGEPTPTLEEDTECVKALFPLQMWLRREVGAKIREAYSEIRKIREWIWALNKSNTSIYLRLIEQDKRITMLEKAMESQGIKVEKVKRRRRK